jgi:DNA-binding response OmpR family regulator
LTGKEFSILEYLMRHQGEVVSQEALLEHVWDMQANPLTNTVRVHINSLRRKLEDMAETPYYIETCIGHGYRLGTAKNLEET